MAGINNAGLIVGTWQDSNKVNHGFIDLSASSYGGIFASFDAPVSDVWGTYATAINDAGLVVGYYEDTSGYHGFLFNAQTLQFVAAPVDYPGSAGTTMLLGVNGYGQIVGRAGDYNPLSLFIYNYDNGNFTDILTNCEPGALYTMPTGINNNGQIVGYYTTPAYEPYYGFVSNDGVNCSTVSYPTGTTWTELYSINDAGQISGYAYFPATNEYSGYFAVPQTP
jgi:probable HAF family extracellular repeat protein